MIPNCQGTATSTQTATSEQAAGAGHHAGHPAASADKSWSVTSGFAGWKYCIIRKEVLFLVLGTTDSFEGMKSVSKDWTGLLPPEEHLHPET